jgi:hypothetical protein
LADLIETAAGPVVLYLTIDYGIDTNLVHQCAIIIDRKAGLFIAYEPYGTYAKYGMDYASALADMASIYKVYGLKFVTFHQHLQRPIGLQQIILDANNARAAVFEQRVQALVGAAAANAPLQRAITNILVAKRPIYTTDKTARILDIMEVVAKALSASVPNGGTEATSPPTALYQMALALYAEFNSKTCVSITIIELDAYLAKTPLAYDAVITAAATPDGPNTPLMRMIDAAEVIHAPRPAGL